MVARKGKEQQPLKLLFLILKENYSGESSNKKHHIGLGTGWEKLLHICVCMYTYMCACIYTYHIYIHTFMQVPKIWGRHEFW